MLGLKITSILLLGIGGLLLLLALQFKLLNWPESFNYLVAGPILIIIGLGIFIIYKVKKNKLNKH